MTLFNNIVYINGNEKYDIMLRVLVLLCFMYYVETYTNI
jgi:hypothetical protein